MPKTDIHLTTNQYDALLKIEELTGVGRIQYINGLVHQYDTIADILSISTSDLGAKIPYFVDMTEKGVCNVSKVVELFLQVALNNPLTSAALN